MVKWTNVLDKHAPLRQRHNRRRQHMLCPWSTPALRHPVHLRHVAHDRLLKSPTDTAAREVFRDLRKQCTDLSRSLKNAYFKGKCRAYSRDPRSLWNTINALTGRMKTRTPPQASVKDLSDFFASVVTDPNRPIQLSPVQLQPLIVCLTVSRKLRSPQCLSCSRTLMTENLPDQTGSRDAS